MNQVSLTGRITRDLELRDSSNGSKYVYFTVAVPEYRNGNEVTNFVPCVAWERNAENMVKFVGKGSLIAVTGRISVRTNNSNGKYETIVNINADRVEFLDNRSTNNSNIEARENSNYDMDQVNAFEPNQTEPVQQQPSLDKDDNITSDDSILWD